MNIVYLLSGFYFMREFAAAAASVIIGVSLGLMGAGGSILTIPVFVYILNKDPITSGIYSMFVVGICSIAGSIRSMLNKMVDFRTAILFGIPSVAGVLIARKLIFPSIPGQLLVIGSFVLSKDILFMLSLAVLMFFAAIRMLKTSSHNNFIAGAKENVKEIFSFTAGFIGWRYYGLIGHRRRIFNCASLVFLGKITNENSYRHHPFHYYY